MRMHNPPHPGEIISGIMEDLNIGVRELARALNVAPSTIQRVIAGKAAITPEMAVRLEKVLGSTAEMWVRLQSAYSLDKAKKEIDVSGLLRLSQDEANHHHA